MEQEPAQTTLRDTISDAFDSVIAEETPAGGVEQAQIPASSEPAKGDQPRREDGTFAPKEKDSAAAPAKPAQSKTTQAASAPAAAAEPALARPARPSSWKKDYAEHWDKLDPKLAEYLVQREGEYAKGVSTYKNEWDRAKPLIDAIAPFMQDLERHRIAPEAFISNLGNAHRILALGTPEQKLAMLGQLVQDYQIPLQQLFAQGQDGKIYFNPPQAPQRPQQPQGLTEDRVAALVQEQLLTQSTQREIEQFQQAKDGEGKPLYPHFEAVKDTMARIFQAKLAVDLKGAYDYALRSPSHADIAAQLEQAKREADEKRIAEEKAKNAQRARKAAVSPASATPTSVASAGSDKKGLRATIENAFDEVIGGRV